VYQVTSQESPTSYREVADLGMSPETALQMEHIMAAELGLVDTSMSATSLSLASLTPSDGVVASLLSPGITVGGSAAGTVDYGADQDIYPISLTAGESYIFDVTGGTLADPTLALHDANGVQLQFNDDGGPGLNSRVEFTAPSTGSYYLNVGSFGAGTGTYTLSTRVDDAADDIYTTDHVAPDAWQWGTINSGADQDFYAISLTQGQSYTFDVYASGLSDPTLAVRDSAGAQQAYNDDFGPGLDSHIDFVAQYTGTYYLDVGGFSSHTGSYLLVA
jgi:hypothetical protein